jgi:hypothetical protein
VSKERQKAGRSAKDSLGNAKFPSWKPGLAQAKLLRPVWNRGEPSNRINHLIQIVLWSPHGELE